MIAIMGAGAMGGMFAYKLQQAEYPVTLIDVSAETVKAIEDNGLTVEVKNAGTINVQIPITSQPEQVGIADFIIFFVKAQHTRQAAEFAEPMVGPDTVIVSLQNGWGNADVLAEVYPPERILVGVTYQSATVKQPGVIAHTGFGPTIIGPYADEADMQAAERFGKILNKAGIETTVTAAVKSEIWKKLVLNTAALPVAALTRLCSGDMFATKSVLELIDAIATETVQVARASGYDIALAERIESIHKILYGAGPGKASMLQDVEARRKTEIEVVNLAVVRAAEKAGMKAPINEAMVSLIYGLERGWRN